MTVDLLENGVPYGADLGQTSPTCTANRHGTYSSYRNGCRCPEAREAHRVYMKRHREGRNRPLRIDGTGTRRRIQALWAIGHTAEQIGAATGGGHSSQHIYLLSTRTYVSIRNETAVRTAYQALSMTPGASTKSRARALAAGYAPPLAWDDDTIDDPTARPNRGGAGTSIVDQVAITRALAGDPVPLSRTEKSQATQIARQLGGSASQVAELLHVASRTVQRITARQRAAA